MSRIDAIKQAVTPKTGLGVGLGTLMGAVFGGVPGAVIGGTIGGALAHATPKHTRRSKEEMTPKLKLIYERAMTSTSEPAELRKLAAAFDREGFRVHARLLRSRADLRALPESEKATRRQAMAKAFASDKPDGIEKMAGVYDEIGAFNAAKALRLHAAAVRAAHEAGKSAKPSPPETVNSFAARLVEAISHFGQTSTQAYSAAANLIRARGKTPDESSVAELIAEAVAAHPPDAQAATPAPDAPPSAESGAEEPVADPVLVDQLTASQTAMVAQVQGG